MRGCKTIEQLIAETDIDGIRATLPGAFPYDPYSYQWATHRVTAEEIRNYTHPFVVKAAVSAGKTTLISLVSRRINDINKRIPSRASQKEMLILSRQGEIVEQDSEEMANFKVPNSRFSASLGRKSAHHPIIAGSEGTVVNELAPITKDGVFRRHGMLENFTPQFLLIDECQHVDVTDIINSEQNKENSIEQMKMNNRKVYTIIIRELQRRCREKFGREMVIIGYTGTDYRGIEPIINEDLRSPGFWRKKIVDISTDYLVKFGAVVPTHFGSTSGLGYDLSKWQSDGNDGDGDFSSSQMAEMEQAIIDDATMTQMIMADVVEQTRHGLSVLVTCAGRRHCEEAARALPDGVTWGIVTDDTPDRERKRILDEAKAGRMKFVFQVGCLTTGINCPPWEYCVILRRIGSLTLLTQLIGRVMRKLKKSHEEAGMVKESCTVLDYGGAMDALGDLYFAPMLEQYQYEKAVLNNETIPCPKCGAENSKFARRCIGEDASSSDGRCEFFFKSRICEDVMHPRIKGRVVSKGCGAENDIAARFCRKCDNMLIDPNKKLSGQSYTVDDYCDVLEFDVEPGKGDSIAVKYFLKDPETQQGFKAWEIHHPFQYDNRQARAAWKEMFVRKHVAGETLQDQVMKCKTVGEIMALKDLFMRPDRVTHRKINNGRKDVITRKVFNAEGKDFND